MRERGSLIRADSAYKICRKAWQSFQGERFTEAEARFRASLQVEDNAEAFYGLGVTLNILGQIDEAIICLQRALDFNPQFSLAYGVLGEIHSARGEGIFALEYYAQGVVVDPENYDYKSRFIQLISGLTFSRTNSALKRALQISMDTPGIELGDLGLTWLSIVESDEVIGEVYKLSRQKDYESFKSVFDRLPDYDGFADPFFLTGLGNFIVPDAGFERWCVYLRRVLLESLSGENLFGDVNRTFLACALSRYCFLTDYIFEDSPEELAAVKALKSSLEKLKPEEVSLTELAVLGCYIPIYRLKKARKIAELLPGGVDVSQIPKSQILDFMETERLRKKIPALTPIVDDVSQKVQLQYEEFPYPLWTALSPEIRDQEIEGRLIGAKARILVAGCGTGRDALELAAIFPDAEVLGVDLSKASLAYAELKRERFGIKNATFKQADILELGGIEARFDYIVCSGVLHHLAKPMEGWRVLTDLLKPGGLMHVALYSSKAREAINQARDAIVQEEIENDALSIRLFRRDVRTYLKVPTIKELEIIPDYYTVPGCRSLLFHAQEHQYDIPQIHECLDELGLEFLKFHLPVGMLEAYVRRFPDDPEGANLEYWDRWEIARPNTFAGMYRFWCRKP